jgi:antitoxin (DNA-binding transcriptional repressor) of toxin-antitoxin stability system
MELLTSQAKIVSIHEAKTHLSQLLQFIAERKGNKVMIRKGGKSGVLLAELVPIQPEILKRRPLGLLEGQMIIPDDFDELPDEFMSYFR